MSVSEGEGSDSADRQRDTRQFLVRVVDGREFKLGSGEDVIRKRQTNILSSGQYHRVSPDILSEGDEVIHLPEDVREELWTEHLTELYESELADEGWAVNREGLRIWFDTISEILKAQGVDVDEGEVPYGAYQSIYNKLDAGGLDKEKSAVFGWFRSVLKADEPIDLVERRDLRIGPRNEEDIAVIGAVFDKSKLKSDEVQEESAQSNAAFIDRSMKSFRKINRTEGREFRDWVVGRLSDEDNRVTEAAETLIVEVVCEKESE